jgi:hypothetical protein
MAREGLIKELRQVIEDAEVKRAEADEAERQAEGARVFLSSMGVAWRNGHLAPARETRPTGKLPLVSGDDAEIRAWANRHNIKIGKRGRIPADIRKRHDADVARTQREGRGAGQVKVT